MDFEKKLVWQYVYLEVTRLEFRLCQTRTISVEEAHDMLNVIVRSMWRLLSSTMNLKRKLSSTVQGRATYKQTTDRMYERLKTYFIELCAYQTRWLLQNASMIVRENR